MNKQDTATAAMMALTNRNVKIRDEGGSMMLDVPDIEKIPWFHNPDFPGLYGKILMYDYNTGLSVNLTRVEKGSRLAVHAHLSNALVFMIKGRMTYEPTGSIGPGGFGYEAYGVVHEPDMIAGEETVFFTVSTNHSLLQFYNADGTLGKIQHTGNRLREIRKSHGHAAVAHLGLPDWFWEE